MDGMTRSNTRTRTGFSLFVLGNLLAVTGLALAAAGHAYGRYVALIVGLMGLGEAVILGSVLLLGEHGYRNLEARASLLPPTVSVTERRHRVGIVLLVLHFLGYYLVWTAGILAYTRATPEDPLPTIAGLTFAQQGPAFVWAVIVCELLFATAIYVLGPRWWEGFESLFRYHASTESQADSKPKPPPGMRYRIGLVVFVIGNVLATSGLILPAIGLAKGSNVGFVAVLIATGEIVSLSSIFLLGKEGFKELKHRLFNIFKRTPSGAPISKSRHRVAVMLVTLHVVAQLAALVFPIASHFGLASDGAFPTVLGLDHDQQLRWFVGLLIAQGVLFFAGIYAFGADWWGRFRELFQWEGT